MEAHEHDALRERLRLMDTRPVEYSVETFGWHNDTQDVEEE